MYLITKSFGHNVLFWNGTVWQADEMLAALYSHTEAQEIIYKLNDGQISHESHHIINDDWSNH